MVLGAQPLRACVAGRCDWEMRDHGKGRRDRQHILVVLARMSESASCLQGSEPPAAEPARARADSDMRARATNTQQQKILCKCPPGLVPGAVTAVSSCPNDVG